MIDSSGVGRRLWEWWSGRKGECGNGGDAVGMDGAAQQVTDGSRGTWETLRTKPDPINLRVSFSAGPSTTMATTTKKKKKKVRGGEEVIGGKGEE